MGRPAKGSVAFNATKNVWEVRVTLVNGKRSKPIAMTGLAPCLIAPSMPPKGCTCPSCVAAEENGQRVSIRMRNGAHVDVATSETANEWFERLHKHEVELGQTDAVKKRHRWLKWIAPRIGHKPMHEITRDDVEDVRDALDASIETWKKSGGKSGGTKGDAIAGKTAMNVWSCLTSAFKAATASKRRDLRILDGRPNPCVGVLPPGDRDSRKARRKTFLYPKEAHALLSCEAISLEWREVYAVALYTYLRPGELRVLTVGDVDLDAGHINVTKAWDFADEKIKPPKTRNGVRRVPIELALRPLLARLCEGKGTTDLVVPCLASFGEDHLAEKFRNDLEKANVTRAELHASTRTHVKANFRSCRDSGVTWLAMAGLGVDKIMRRAGHDMVQTTMGYVKQAEDLTGDLGAPFGSLPPALLDPKSFGGVSVFRSEKPQKLREKGWARRDLNPRLQPCEGRTLPLSYAPRMRENV